MRRTHEHGTKARLSFSGGPQVPLNMADSTEEVDVGRKNKLRYISHTKFSQILEDLWDLHCLFGSTNSPTTDFLHTVRHVYRSLWPIREAKPRSGATRERSAHDCETRIF